MGGLYFIFISLLSCLPFSKALSVGRRLDILKFCGLGRYNPAVVISYYRKGNSVTTGRVTGRLDMTLADASAVIPHNKQSVPVQISKSCSFIFTKKGFTSESLTMRNAISDILGCFKSSFFCDSFSTDRTGRKEVPSKTKPLYLINNVQ